MPNTIMRDKIKHVVVLMLENRGFDHVLGWLYDGQYFKPQNAYPSSGVPLNQQRLRSFEGLSGLPLAELKNRCELVEKGIPMASLAVAPKMYARSPKTPSINPHEDFVHIQAQMWGVPYQGMEKRLLREGKIGEVSSSRGSAKPPMNGFVQDYATEVDEVLSGASLNVRADRISEIMETYTPEQLPVLNGLARHYGVSDLWFCSVPSQTNTNRAFVLAGTARGMVTNNFYHAYPRSPKYTHADALPAHTRTLLHVLQEHGADWMYFWQSPWPPPPLSGQYARTMFPDLADSAYDANFAKLEAFEKLAAQGKLPAFSFIEPRWGGGKQFDPSALLSFMQGNDMHPPSELTQGEDLIMKVYDALRKGKGWDETLLVVTFDENGGTYDHFPPPAASPSCLDPVPYGAALDKKAVAELDPVTGTQFGFGFDSLGVRVPTLLISPYIPRATVFRSPTDVSYDHTSIIATVLEWRGIPRGRWNLGGRVANAPTFDQVLTLTTPRTDVTFGARPPRMLKASVLKYGDPFRLKYIGNKWGPPSQTPPYLAKFETAMGTGSLVRQYYPRVGGLSDAAVLVLTGGTKGAPVTNGDLVAVVSTEKGLGDYDTLGAWSTDHYLVYGKPGSKGQVWQIRLPSYPENDERVHTFDEVVLMNGQFAYQRMMPDTGKPDYLTSRGGEWAFWQIEV
jgi:phospholipase C